MKALISPNEEVSYISGWDTSTENYIPIYTILGKRICDVVEVPFEVCPPLFWIDVPEGTNGDMSFYDESTKEIKLKLNNVDAPKKPQPISTGTQNI